MDFTFNLLYDLFLGLILLYIILNDEIKKQFVYHSLMSRNKNQNVFVDTKYLRIDGTK